MFHDQEHVRTSHLELRHKVPENMVLLYSPLSALRQYLASSIVAVWAGTGGGQGWGNTFKCGSHKEFAAGAGRCRHGQEEGGRVSGRGVDE